MKSLADCRLYTFVDTTYLHGRRPELVAQQLCEGGSDIIQLRAKHSSRDEVLRMAEMILPITRKAGVPLVINDHLEVAQACGAEVCHLGQEDFFEAGFTNVSELRRPGSDLIIGLSTHGPEQAARALTAEADYVAIGPIYATGTKPKATPVTLKYVQWAAANISVPWFAIGGVNLQTIEAVRAAGATRFCVVSAILNEPDIAKACGEFLKKL
jgi:thiamine-phosphate pyrophosphorylase